MSKWKGTEIKGHSNSASAVISRMFYLYAVKNGICTACRNNWAEGEEGVSVVSVK